MKTLVSQEAREYKAQIKRLALCWGIVPLKGRLEVTISAYMPDNRKRDLDNLLKITLDSLKETGIFEDDSQIDRLSIERSEVHKPGKLMVYLKEIEVFDD